MPQATIAITPKSEGRSFQSTEQTRPDHQYPSFHSGEAIAQEAMPKMIAPQPPTPAQERLGDIRIDWRDLAGETALVIKRLSQATVEQAMEIGQHLLRMQSDLKKNEYSTFLSVLGWASAKARKFINLAKTFSDFERSHLVGIELTTLLSLCSSRYSGVVAQLREFSEITQELVEQLVKETQTPRKQKQEPVSGWKQSRSGGGRYYNVLLHSEEVGISIESQADAEEILPQRVIEEAIALRAAHKSSPVPVSDYRAAQLEELQDVVENARVLDRENRELSLEVHKRGVQIAELKELLSERSAVNVEAGAISLIDARKSAIAPEMVEAELETEVAALIPESASESTQETVQEGHNTATAQESSPQDAAQALEPVEAPRPAEIPQSDEHSEEIADATAPQSDVVLLTQEKATTTTAAQNAVGSEQVRSAQLRDETSNTSVMERHVIRPDWDQLNQIRGAESYLRNLDSQIKEINTKLENHNLDRNVVRELKGVLANRQKLRSNKIAQIVVLADSHSIPADYEALRTQGRFVLEPSYAEKFIRRAKTWTEVAMIVGQDKGQLARAVKEWGTEEKFVLIQMLSSYLSTEATALTQIDWLPKTLLDKSLSTLSFTLKRIAKTNNVVDDIEWSHLHGCKFVAVEKLGTQNERWTFEGDGQERIDMFDREYFWVEKG